jgi:CDP-diacylglycerol--glycerol-3-phosphate 3-phosphatidyltransferase
LTERDRQANGFYQSKGVSGMIPPGYTLLEQRFRKAILERGKGHQIGLREWSRPGWTYHSKGILRSLAC